MHRQSTQNLARAVSQLRSRLAMETPTIVRCRRVSAAHSVVGRPAKRTSGFAHTDMNGTLSIREEYALPACISGLRPSASHAPGGLRTRSGLRSDFRSEIMTPVEGQTISGGKPPITLRSDQSGVSLTSAVPASVPMQHARLGSCHGAFLNHCPTRIFSRILLFRRR